MFSFDWLEIAAYLSVYFGSCYIVDVQMACNLKQMAAHTEYLVFNDKN